MKIRVKPQGTPKIPAVNSISLYFSLSLSLSLSLSVCVQARRQTAGPEGTNICSGGAEPLVD